LEAVEFIVILGKSRDHALVFCPVALAQATHYRYDP
jgi:hypothetical protein